MFELAYTLIKRINDWQIPATGSKLEYYAITLASTSETDLVHNSTAAITGKGELVAVGHRAAADTVTNRLSSILTTVDGGSEYSITGLGAAGGMANYTGMSSSDAEHVETQWIPCNLPFKTSLLVQVTSTTAIGGNLYVYAIVRKVV